MASDNTAAIGAYYAAREVDGVNLMSATAGVAMRAEIENLYKTNYILSKDQVCEIQSLCGYSVNALGKEPLPSCHWQLAVMRDMLRKSYDQHARPVTTYRKTLVVGASAREIAAYWSNPNVEFYIHGTESKDTTRVILRLLDEVRDIWSKKVMVHPDISESDIPKKKVRSFATLRGLDDLVRFYQDSKDGDVGGTSRIHLNVPDTKYEMLLFEDSHYNLSRLDWLRWFHRTGALCAWVIGTSPVELLFPGVPVSSGLKFVERENPTDMPITDLFCALSGFLLPLVPGVKAGDVFLGLLLRTIYKFVRKNLDNIEGSLDGLTLKLRQLSSYAVRVVPDWALVIPKIGFCLIEWLRDNDNVQLIMTFKGHSNGYVHGKNAFYTLLKYPKIQLPCYDFALKSEMFQRVGPIALYNIELAGLTETICRTISLPYHDRCVEVLDIVASYDFLNGKPREPVYFTMLHREFYDVVDFLAAQKPETISAQMAMTMIRRGAAGLSLGKSVVAPPWRLGAEMLHRAAMVTCLVGLERRAVSEMVTDEKFSEMITRVDSRWNHFCSAVLRAGLCIATAGLAIPIFGLYAWFTQKHIKFPLYRELPFEVDQVVERPIYVKPGTTRISHPCKFDIEVKNVPRGDFKSIESCCDFVKMLGDVGLQDPICMHSRECGAYDTVIEYTADDVARLRVELTNERDASSGGLYDAIDGCVDQLDTVRNGFVMKTRVERLQGPPGVGKSFTMRRFLDGLSKSGNAVAVYSPMSKLGPDYTVKKDGVGPFQFRTTHTFYKIGKLSVMVVEEYTNMDERLIAFMAYRSGAQLVVMIGDEKQTGLQPDEGVRPFNVGGKFCLKSVREHILPINFRSDMYTVALLNRVCGYTIYANNDHVEVPQFKPTSEFDADKYRPICFSKQTAGLLQQELGKENTVRKNQGQTTRGTCLYITDFDDKLVDNDALLAVAISRHECGTPLIVFGDTSEALSKLRDKLRVDDADFLKNVGHYARPDYRTVYNNLRVDRFGEDDYCGDEEIVSRLAGAGVFKTESVSVEDYWNDLVGEVCVDDDDAVEQLGTTIDTGRVYDTAYYPDIEWCTARVLGNVRKFRGRTISSGFSVSDYVKFVVDSGLKSGPVKFTLFMSYLVDRKISWLMCDTRDGSVSGNWRWGTGTDCFGIMFMFNGSHVWSMSNSHLELLVTLSTVRLINRDTGRFVKIKYCPYETVLEVEMRNSVTISGAKGSQFMPTMSLLYTRSDTNVEEYTVRLDSDRVSEGSTVGDSETSGGIGLFGPDDVLVDRQRIQLRNDLAVVMSAENDYSFGGTTSIEREDRFPLMSFPEREFSWMVDGYLHGELVDPMIGIGLRTNAVGAAMGPSKLLTNMTLKVDPLFIRLDRRGRNLGDFETARAFGGGFGYTQTASVVETLGAAQRYFVKPRGARTSVQGRRHAIDMADKHYYRGFDDDGRFTFDLIDGIHNQFLSHALRRSYDQRALGLAKIGTSERLVTFTNKMQFKVSKLVDVFGKISKVGQGISATSSAINLRYGPIMRIVDHAYALMGKHWNIFDCYMSDEQLMDRVFEETSVLPSVARPVTTDADEFDACQNWHSARAEARLNSKFISRLPVFEQYIDEVRTDYPVAAPGLFVGSVKQAKPSGAPDTLGGNTKCSDMYTEELIDGSGPKVMVKKGDDKSRIQYGQKIRRDKEALLRRYSPLTLKITVGDTQFCGKVMTTYGMYDNIIGLCRKALAHWDRDYKTWAEYQLSLRDRLRIILKNGLAETVYHSSCALGVPEPVGWAAYGVLQSLCHISESQWRSATVDVVRNYPAPRDAKFTPRPWGI